MVNQLRKAVLVMLATAAVLAACAPAQTGADPNQGQVATSVAMTVQAQVGGIAQAVVSTLTAQAPAETATSSPTPIPLNLPVTDTPFATFTPFVVTPPPGGSGGSTGATTPDYACSWREVKPRTNVFSPGDAIDVVWVITNTGAKDWGYKLDLEYVSGRKMSTFLGQELPNLKPGDDVTVSFDANAPMQKGLYGMQFKVQGGLCWPALNIQVGKLRDP